jgi:hypothetical protein
MTILPATSRRIMANSASADSHKGDQRVGKIHARRGYGDDDLPALGTGDAISSSARCPTGPYALQRSAFIAAP